MLNAPAIDLTKFDAIPEPTAWQAPHMAETLTEQIFVGTLLLNTDYQVVYADKTAELLLGQTTQELKAKNGRDILGADAFASLELSAGQTHRYTTQLKRVHKADSPATITLTRNIIDEKKQHTIATIAVINDNHEMQESLQLNQRLASLGMLTASIAHELKNPISVITNTCDNLNLALADEDPNVLGLTRYVTMIQKNAWHCAHLVDALRSYMHKSQHGELSSLNELIQDAIDLVIPQFQRQRDIKVHVDLGVDVEKLICVPSQITQIVVNLLTNACDAISHKDGQVWIKTWDVPELDSIAVSVRDNGRGIPEELMEDIFEPFFTTKRQADGTGLGLFIAAEIVKRHNGWIRVQNQLNENTEVEGVQFTVMLPRK